MEQRLTFLKFKRQPTFENKESATASNSFCISSFSSPMITKAGSFRESRLICSEPNTLEYGKSFTEVFFFCYKTYVIQPNSVDVFYDRSRTFHNKVEQSLLSAIARIFNPTPLAETKQKKFQ